MSKTMKALDDIEKQAYWSGRSDEAARQYERIAELEAHVGRLRDYVSRRYDKGRCDDLHEEGLALLEETPAQSLNEIKAAAIEEALDKVNVRWFDNEPQVMVKSLRRYGKRLRGEV